MYTIAKKTLVEAISPLWSQEETAQEFQRNKKTKAF